MKKHLSFFALLIALFASAPAFGQAAPPASEAKDLVTAAAEAKPEIEALLPQVQRSTKPYAKDVEAMLKSSFALVSRIERAGEKMSAAQLSGFKSEMEVLDARLDKIKADNQPTAGWLFNCFNSCYEKWPKWWMALQCFLCKVRCFTPF